MSNNPLYNPELTASFYYGDAQTNKETQTVIVEPSPADETFFDENGKKIEVKMSKNLYEKFDIPVPNFSPDIKSNLVQSFQLSNPLNENVPFLNMASKMRMEYQTHQQIENVKDARDFVNDNELIPSGIQWHQINEKTGKIEIFPAVIQESHPQVLPKQIGPVRTSENALKRKRVKDMYGLDERQMNTFVGVDSLGNKIYSDGNSYLERLISTGYAKSFEQPKIPHYFVSRSFDIYGNLQSDLVAQNFVDQTILISKSGYYYTSTTPIRSILLGYNDENILPSEIPVFWQVSREDFNSPANMRYFYNDDINAKELKYFRKKDKDLQNADLIQGDYLEETLFWSKNIFKKLFDANNNLVTYDEIKSYVTINNLNVVPVVKKGIDIPPSYAEGSYRRMIFNLNKHDEIEQAFYASIDSSLSLDARLNSIKSFSNVNKPMIVRRSEQYGPNPLQHLFYMDFFDWRKYTTTYLLKRYNSPYIKHYLTDEWERDQKDLRQFGESYRSNTILERKTYSQWQQINDLIPTVKDQDLQKDLYTFYLGNRLTYLLGRTSDSVTLSSFISNDYLDPSLRWSKSGDDSCLVDNTYILDIYFGLMEMHLRGFSWDTIMRIVDLIPQFHGDHFDTSYVGWRNLSKKEKDQIRLRQLDIGLKPVWELIEKILINAVNNQYV